MANLLHGCSVATIFKISGESTEVIHEDGTVESGTIRDLQQTLYYNNLGDYTYSAKITLDLSEITGVEVISSSFFHSGTTFSEIILPASLKKIASWGLNANGLTSVTFPVTTGWKFTDANVGTTIAIDVSDPATNATNLTTNGDGIWCIGTLERSE